MNYFDKLRLMREFVTNNFDTAAELVDWLQMSVEDVISIFPDALVNHYERVYPLDLEELDQQSDEQELQAWNGVEVFGDFTPGEDYLEE